MTHMFSYVPPQIFGPIMGFLSTLTIIPLSKFVINHLERCDISNHADDDVKEKLARVAEWYHRYPYVSFRRSEYACTLLADLYIAEMRYAQLQRSKTMRPGILNFIFDLLEKDPDNLPPNDTSPNTGLVLFSLYLRAVRQPSFPAQGER